MKNARLEQTPYHSAKVNYPSATQHSDQTQTVSPSTPLQLLAANTASDTALLSPPGADATWTATAEHKIPRRTADA